MRALIIGYGSIGQRHLRNLRALDPDIECVILRRNSEQSVPDALVVTDLSSALALKPALAVVATPSAAHVDSLVDLIAARVPSYVEKPVVTEAAHVSVVRQALAEYPGVRHVAGFNLRLLPSLKMAHALVQQGRLGTVVRASFSAGQWLPDWRRGADFRQSYSSRKSDGGGVIFDLSHELDAARYFLGEMAVESCATMQLPSLGIEAESAACILGRTAMGGLVNVNVDYVARRPIRRYELVGDCATLVWDVGARRLELHDPEGVEIVTEQAEDFDVGRTYSQAMRVFVDCVTGGDTGGLQDLEDGLRSTELAINASVLGAP